MTTVLVGPRRVHIGDRDLLGEGGEGRVYRSGDLAIKIFLTPSEARKRKLLAFPKQLPPRVIGPIELCRDTKGEIVGYAMRRLDGAVDAQRLSQRRWRAGTVRNEDVLRIIREITETVDELHARGVVVGDLNDGNIVLTGPPAAPSPWLIDADSMQLPGHPCVVAHERFLDPRLYGVDLSKAAALSNESDWYALAVLLFSSLLYVHPYGGAHPSYPTMLRRAEARHSVLHGDVKLPLAAARFDILPDDTLSWFFDVFERDARARAPSAVYDARFVACSCGVEHARKRCPACVVQALVRPRVRAKGDLRATVVARANAGRIVAASAWGSLAYAASTEDAFSQVTGPVYRVCAVGSSTWIGTKDRMMRFIGGKAVESIPVTMALGELAADAGPAGLVHTYGDSLVRASDGTRIGQVLEGQTRLRVGATLGFAFYRAGRLTVAFVFDPRKGPLRQVALPPIEGRLVDWSATFDDGHVLVTFVTELGGKVLHAAHLVDAHGVVVASAKGAPDSSPVLASVTGKCLAGGSVLCATDEGLVLVRADRAAGAFVATRLFADAKELVSLDAELLLGPGGSVYVVTNEEIVHLCFNQT